MWNGLVATFVVVLLAAGACSSPTAADLSDRELRDELVRNLTDEPNFTEDRAGCVVDQLFATTTRDELNRISDAQVLDELSTEEFNLVTDAIFECLRGSADGSGGE